MDDTVSPKVAEEVAAQMRSVLAVLKKDFEAMVDLPEVQNNSQIEVRAVFK